ncbi:dTDP-4-dehydrorhamnose reductase [Daejeonella rubra]|uniref:dTDP-4-dehydrorhamnose reductase n=1 Tax=Daejeonella rubra TaxID=990371 RepID=A0A1G9YZ82_9SPHI|nr:dTDP-4-dehydrorhamnose reductase [Daejeonella rubra]SDN14025.1 dTDP-4-dehydrorhamnose reductase [Daejeonella rubra]
MSKILVFGSSGQLGQCLKLIAEEKKVNNILFFDRLNSDILSLNLLGELFYQEHPDFVINCAAYTAVDKAEDEIEQTRKVNRDGAANLALLSKRYGSILIHISTDFVFGGKSALPLKETDLTDPVNIYGLTKLEGENAIIKITERYFILRTSWLYSEFGNNFVKTMLKLGKQHGQLKVIADQLGTPTYAIDLANCIFHIINSSNTSFGIYHYSNQGTASWYDFAKAIFDISDIPVKVLPIPGSEYITKAKRPAYSIMNKSKIELIMQIKIPYWHDSLKKCLSQINNSR